MHRYFVIETPRYVNKGNHCQDPVKPARLVQGAPKCFSGLVTENFLTIFLFIVYRVSALAVSLSL